MIAHRLWDEDAARQIVRQEMNRPGALLPVLHAVQAEFGWLPPEAIGLVAVELNLTQAEVHGVVTFYHDFRVVPPSAHVLKLCVAESCQAMGARVLQATLAKSDNVAVEPVHCLGLCAQSPAALLDGEPLGRLTAAGLADRLRDKVASA